MNNVTDNHSNLRNPPDADRAIWGFRDTGYSFETALADVVDNSIAADADNIFVKIDLLADGRRLIYIGDDGHGMSPSELRSAMRYGSPERENKASLGKFGLGLKTASTAISICLTVISKRAGGQLSKLAWDLDYVAEKNDWLMLEESITQEEVDKFEELCGGQGTLVVWSKCDRLLSKQNMEPGGSEEMRAISRLKDKLVEHFSLVYHRYLDSGDDRARNVSITLDDKQIEPWSPFLEDLSDSVLAENLEKITLELDDSSIAEILVKAWILPPKEKMTKDQQTRAKLANQRQGFYVYRENRIISDGGWNGVFGAPEPHKTLIRVQFDFDHKADDALRVDVKKSKVNFDPALEEYLSQLLTGPRRDAEQRYRRRVQEKASSGIDHTASNINVQETKNTAKPQVVSTEESSNVVVINNNRGSGLKIKAAVETAYEGRNVFIKPTPLTSGLLWEPVYKPLDGGGHSVSVHINSGHDFYTKIYQSARKSGHAVEGMDLLLWALAAAEQNNVNEELEEVFEELREEISSNLKKLLKNKEIPDLEDE
jgi:hypothetical protein